MDELLAFGVPGNDLVAKVVALADRGSFDVSCSIDRKDEIDVPAEDGLVVLGVISRCLCIPVMLLVKRLKTLGNAGSGEAVSQFSFSKTSIEREDC